ncbi:sorting nexin-14-like [Cydia amplana]|uniref:sorting nexin-14-like n=1 Tax=Cydia amplana TaxID=1869771 RepID=UPI002FE574D8
MTERCQTKFTEKFENQNYVIYVGILVASLAVLYVYRFHFATIAVSYVLGCVACYYGLNSNVLDSLVNKIKCHSVLSNIEDEAEKSGETGCATCDSDSCARHDSAPSSEPWVGLQIHKQLDEAIEQFYNAILEQFIGAWYKRLSERWLFTDELRLQLRRASARLLRRVLKVNYSRFLTERLIPCALRHYTLYADAGAGRAPHPAACTRAAELKYLRSVTDAIMPYLLNDDELHSAVFHLLVREIFAGWVLLSLTDLLADPYIINALIILATGDETMAQLKTTPDYRVEFLSTLARQSGSTHEERAHLLHVDLELLVGEPRHLYAFMQHVKSTSQLQLLQFYKDINIGSTHEDRARLLHVDLELLVGEPRHLYAFMQHVKSTRQLQLLQFYKDINIGSTHEDRARLLHVDLELLVGEPRHLYAFMQHVKSTSQLQLLQFYKDINIGSTHEERARLLHVDLELLVGEPRHLYAFMQHVKSTRQLQLLQFYKDIS